MELYEGRAIDRAVAVLPQTSSSVRKSRLLSLSLFLLCMAVWYASANCDDSFESYPHV